MTPAIHEKSLFLLEPSLQDPFYRHIYDCLEEGRDPAESSLKLLSLAAAADADDPFLQIEGYRKELALHVVCTIKPKLREHLREISSVLYKSTAEGLPWKEFQLRAAYRLLCGKLSGESEEPSIIWVQTDQGAAPIDYGRHWKWASVPLQPYHMELGILWVLLGITSHQKDLVDAADRLAQFQLTLLDNDCLPLQGIFSHEKDASLSNLIGFCSVLFYYLGHALQKSEYLSIFKMQGDYLLQSKLAVHPLLPLLLRWKAFGESPIRVSPPTLPKSFLDRTLGLLAKRSDNLVSISVLHGGRTSLGAYHVHKDLSIVAFGPQYLPYGDCQRFGIESVSYLQKEASVSSIEKRENGYLLKGIAKVMGKTIYTSPYTISGNSCHSEMWLDVEQELSDRIYHLKIGYLSYEKENSLSLVFYIKASECSINGLRTLKPKSLDRYHGETRSLTFATSSEKILLEPLFTDSVLEVIPLAGDESFWGCDFLVGFTAAEHSNNHCWKISSTAM